MKKQINEIMQGIKELKIQNGEKFSIRQLELSVKSGVIWSEKNIP